MVLHGRSELALHRWDLVGSDSVSLELLERPELLAHGETVLARMGLREAGGVGPCTEPPRLPKRCFTCGAGIPTGRFVDGETAENDRRRFAQRVAQCGNAR